MFSNNPEMSRKGLAVGSAFTSICIGAIGLSLVRAQTDLVSSTAALAIGFVIAYLAGKSIRPLPSFLLSAAGLAIYIKASTS
jgi:cell division protein FtsW (lipid II flippase)